MKVASARSRQDRRRGSPRRHWSNPSAGPQACLAAMARQHRHPVAHSGVLWLTLATRYPPETVTTGGEPPAGHATPGRLGSAHARSFQSVSDAIDRRGRSRARSAGRISLGGISEPSRTVTPSGGRTRLAMRSSHGHTSRRAGPTLGARSERPHRAWPPAPDHVPGPWPACAATPRPRRRAGLRSRSTRRTAQVRR